MNNNIKCLIAFVGGVALGGGAGFYVTKQLLTKQHDADLEEVRGFYKSENETLEKEVADLKEQVAKKIEVDIPAKEEKKTSSKKKKEVIEEAKKEEAEYQEVIEKTNYAAISEKPKTSSKKKKAAVDPDIFVIEPNDFSSRENGYDKVTLTYFDSDDIFLGDNDETFADGHEVVGSENLDRFGEYEDGVLYVRNRLTETDYEVIMETRSVKKYMSEEYGE